MTSLEGKLMSTSISANLTTPTFFGKYLNISCRPWWSVDTPPKRRFTYWNTNIYHNIGWKCIHSPTIIAEFQWFTTLEMLSELGAVPFDYLHLFIIIYGDVSVKSLRFTRGWLVFSTHPNNRCLIPQINSTDIPMTTPLLPYSTVIMVLA